MSAELIDILVRWGHLLFGITWIGMLYYFNFIQGGYFKEASPEGLADAKAKLAPSALWWFRWGAMSTLITGLILAYLNGYITDAIAIGLTDGVPKHSAIGIGMWLGTIMWFNVWFIIWPNQKKRLGSYRSRLPRKQKRVVPPCSSRGRTRCCPFRCFTQW